MNLSIVTPLSVVVTVGIDSLRAEDASGSFGIMPGHAPFLTALAISVVSWKTAGTDHFCAVRGGVLAVDGDVAIATPEAVTGDDLATLDAEVLARFRADADAERVDRTAATTLQLNAIRQMISRLAPNANAGEFR
jgi:F-type H+-transporting ATPase subunit epsilon